MKAYRKPCLMGVFLLLLGILLFISQKLEQKVALGCLLIDWEDAELLLEGKQLMETPEDLLLYQGQPLPFQKESNVFFIPTDAAGNGSGGSLECSDYGQIFLVSAYDQESMVFFVYVVNDNAYYETTAQFTHGIIMSFYTEAFENENAYGKMNLYTPVDKEINTYSYKSSEAKLSYETVNGLTLESERNYTLKLLKNGRQNKMNLAGLRKDDDWELDFLSENMEEILQFYEEWNQFCINSGEERFLLYYEIVDFYLDGQFAGNYLLRVPMDEKQLSNAGGNFIDIKVKNAAYYEECENLRNRIITNPALDLEYYYWREKKDNHIVYYAIPRRFVKTGQH